MPLDPPRISDEVEADNRKIDYLAQRLESLTDWEQEFIEGLGKLPVDQPLSPGRKVKLYEIFDKY